VLARPLSPRPLPPRLLSLGSSEYPLARLLPEYPLLGLSAYSAVSSSRYRPDDRLPE
jgi:hypothetical protein